MYNKITLMGNLGGDPEKKESASGNIFTTFSVATQNRKDDETEWFRVVTFGKIAESCARYLKKGNRVYVEGPLKTDTWEGDDGVKRTTLAVTGYTVKFLSNKEKEHGDQEIPF